MSAIKRIVSDENNLFASGIAGFNKNYVRDKIHLELRDNSGSDMGGESSCEEMGIA